jgi:pyruvate dehydrogenase E2 component (dihydrolipoyllysine-residue acetyltransferase)
MPALGLAQETGKLVRWLKSEGEQVAKGEPLMEIETDKATVEVESPAGGTLAAVTASEGEDIAVGQTIAMILAPGEEASEVAPRTVASKPPSPALRARREEEGLTNRSLVGRGNAVPARGRPPASPKARRLAVERGLDLSKVAGTGPGGAIVEDDILQAVGGAAADEPAVWRAMADNVSRSWREAPHFFVMREIDASRLVEERGRQHEGVTYTDLLVNTVATALSSHPRMNGSSAEINIGLAVAVPDGLIVPVIHGADHLSVSETSVRRKELLERVRTGKLRLSDLSGGTFTISNLGMYGVDLFTAILPEGQTGILAVGRIADRVVAHQGAPQVRPAMLVSLSCDHRRVDGARAAEFVQTLAALLEGG